MPRLMSVAMTADAVIERRKTVTRRKGWLMLKPGDRLTLCRKVQGRKPGEPLERLAEVQVVSVTREKLGDLLAEDQWAYPLAEEYEYARAELAAEGFPGMSATTFIDTYFAPQGLGADDWVTRIEWRYLDQGGEQS